MLIAVATVCACTRCRVANPSRKLNANGAAPSACTAASRGTREIRPHSHASRSALPKAAVFPRLPAGTTIQSGGSQPSRSEEHTSELQSQSNLVCRLLLEKKKEHNKITRLATLH